MAIKLKPQTTWELQQITACCRRSEPGKGHRRGDLEQAHSESGCFIDLCCVLCMLSLHWKALPCTCAWSSFAPLLGCPHGGRPHGRVGSYHCDTPSVHTSSWPGFCLWKLKLNKVSNLFTAVSLEPGRGRGLVNKCLLKEWMH